MFRALIVGPVIVFLGLTLLYGLSVWSSKGAEKHHLAEWVQTNTNRTFSSYNLEQVKTDKLNLRFNEIIGGGQNQLGHRYVLIVQRTRGSHSPDFHWMCRGQQYGHVIYEDILDSTKFLTFSYGYMPSLKGCKPSVRTSVIVDFQKEK